MHELSVCLQIIDQVREIAREKNAMAVTKITVQIGPLSGVEAPLLQQAFPFAAAQSIASHATLAIEQLPLVVTCDKCGTTTNAKPNRLICGQCGDYHTRLVSGDEMLLASVELTDIDTDDTVKENSTSVREVNHV